VPGVAPAVAPAANGAAADLVFGSFRASRGRHWPLLRRMRALYAELSPSAITDDDLCAFLSFLYICVRVLRPRVIVQTGTAAGTSAIAMGLALRANGLGTLYTIDPEPPEYFGVRNPVAIARRLVHAAGLEGVVRFVRGYSTLPLDAGRMSLPRAPLWRLSAIYRRQRADLLVLDGDHTFLGVYLDLLYGAAGLAPDGPRAVVCHDYLGIPEVRRAVARWRRATPTRQDRLVPSVCGIKFFQL
jgi:hypothetical protein